MLQKFFYDKLKGCVTGLHRYRKSYNPLNAKMQNLGLF